MQKTIERKKVDYLFENLSSALLALSLLLGMVYYIYFSHIPKFNLNLWFFLGITLIVMRTLLYLHFHKVKEELPETKLLKLKKLFFYLTVGTALHLGSGAFFIFPAEVHLQIVLVFFISGLISGAAVTMATYPTLFKIYLFGSLSPYIVILFLQENEASYALGVAIFIYMFFSMITATKVSSSIMKNIVLTLDKFELIKQLQQEVKSSKEANEAKSKFLSVMSHELRTPLNAIIGFSQILQHDKNLDKKTLSFIEKINISGNNLLTLVNSILDFSKISKGEIQYNPTNINFFDLLTQINILIEPQLKQKEINFTHFSSEGLTIFADQQLLKQAFVNILSNAIKFTPFGGDITFTHQLSNQKHIFCIKDSGSGIAEEDLKILFEPFKQAQNAKEHMIQGTGLGLAITAQIIRDLHQGDIWVESTLGEGTSFYISL